MSDFEHRSVVELSIRRKQIIGLPGDDTTLHRLKIGSSLKGTGPLRGLNYDEERKYLPEIVGMSPTDNEWRKTLINYWSNIAVDVPADGVGTGKLQGKPLIFTVAFGTATEKENFERVLSLEEKAELSQKGEVIEGIADYVLFRYCLLYNKVANKFEDIGKSPKILFYLYSKATETRVEHNAFKLRVKANTLFTQVLMDEDVVDAVLLMFRQDLKEFETLQDKHLALEGLLKTKAADFIKFMEDSNLKVKATIKRAVEARIIHNPPNTDSYYYGENNEVTLGTTLIDAVIFWKSDEKHNKEIVEAINARLKQI